MTYIPHNHHRHSAYANQKSQWSITVPEEVSCYKNAANMMWSSNGTFWGLHLNAVVPLPLGVAPLPAGDRLHIAKFVGDPAGNWHGYPVAPWLKPNDRPDELVLKKWLAAGYISSATLAKIHRSKKCAL